MTKDQINREHVRGSFMRVSESLTGMCFCATASPGHRVASTPHCAFYRAREDVQAVIGARRAVPYATAAYAHKPQITVHSELLNAPFRPAADYIKSARYWLDQYHTAKEENEQLAAALSETQLANNQLVRLVGELIEAQVAQVEVDINWYARKLKAIAERGPNAVTTNMAGSNPTAGQKEKGQS